MAKKITISSPTGTPAAEVIFIIEETGVTNRVKMRKDDVVKEIQQIDDDIVKKQARKVELEAIKSEMDKLL